MKEFAELLGRCPPRAIDDPALKPAAVLVPLFLRGGQLHFLMGRRSSELENHAGQVAFPGGTLEEYDRSVEDCALREAEEEVGLKRADVTVLGRLDDEVTVTGYRISPLVGTFPYPYPLRLDSAEFTELLQVPWTVFVDPTLRREETVVYQGKEYRVDFYKFGEHVIWGATARITRRLIDLAAPLLRQGGEL
jgi:8-oxo-dGTP pyrophosphatase MutT (NUDIX family)